MFDASKRNAMEAAPPRRLSNDPNHADYNPAFMRVGLRIDGEERNDVGWYDADALEYRVRGMVKGDASVVAQSIEPYWRFAETRQQRRARERWEGKAC